MHQHVLVLGDQELVLGAVHVGDDQALLALGLLAEGNGAGHVGQHAGVLGRTRFEELSHPRQTAGNVAVFYDYACRLTLLEHSARI